MLKGTGSQVVATVFLLVMFVVVALSSSGRNASFKTNATLAIATLAADNNPIELCNSGEAIAAGGGEYARCKAVEASEVYAITLTFYPSKKAEEVQSPNQQIGRAFLTFEKPHHLTNAKFKREGGEVFD
jgi:hypothetical protein